MKIIYEFDPDTDGDTHKLYGRGPEFHSSLWKIHEYIRNKIKHTISVDGTQEFEKMLEEIRRLIPELEG